MDDNDLMAQVTHLLESGKKTKEASRLKLVALEAQKKVEELDKEVLQEDAAIADMAEQLRARRERRVELAQKRAAGGNKLLAESVKAREDAGAAANVNPRLTSMAELELKETKIALEQARKELTQLKIAKAPGVPKGQQGQATRHRRPWTGRRQRPAVSRDSRLVK
ncbi:hypothetical protein IWW37_004507 [Coemansia sp. RSA 2050]|nr:hypothetical protein IWW37_004507 [Coemansia sp. RSA 2050]